MTFLGAFRSTNRPVSVIIYACAVVSSSSNNKYATLIGPLSGDATSRGCVYDACSQETGPARPRLVALPTDVATMTGDVPAVELVAAQDHGKRIQRGSINSTIAVRVQHSHRADVFAPTK